MQAVLNHKTTVVENNEAKLDTLLKMLIDADAKTKSEILDICKDSLSGIGGEIRPGIVHRLDKDTSRNNSNSKKR